MPLPPNARYVFGRKDYEFFSQQTHEAHHREAYLDSIVPIVDAGLADIVESDHCVHREIEDGVWLQDAAGHSAGCVVVNAQRGGLQAAFNWRPSRQDFYPPVDPAAECLTISPPRRTDILEISPPRSA